MLTARGRLAVLLGLGLYVAGWAFGSLPLYPVAVGLLLAVALAWGWVRLLDRPMELRRVSAGVEHVEGEDVSVVLELDVDARVKPADVLIVDEVRGIGAVEVFVRQNRGGVLGGRYVLPRMARGRYPFERTTAVLEDPFGLEREEVDLTTGGALLVYPRLVELDRLFSEAGANDQGGRRLLLRRPSGFDLHSVREYEHGESLRMVHWRTTARRGRLMVKELEDEPRDEVAVLLDAAAGVSAGDPPDSSFDMQVRAAGSILRAHARRGRRVALVVNSAGRETLSLRGPRQRLAERDGAARRGRAERRDPGLVLPRRRERGRARARPRGRDGAALAGSRRARRPARCLAARHLASSSSTRPRSPGGRRRRSPGCCACSRSASP